MVTARTRTHDGRVLGSGGVAPLLGIAVFGAVDTNDRTANLVIWILVWAVVFAWIIVTTRSSRLPSVADVTRFARRFWMLRWALLAFWVWLGWHLFVRITV